MKIANFRDYVKVLREVYSRENMDELGNYYRALMASGSALKKQKALLQKEVYHLNAAGGENQTSRRQKSCRFGDGGTSPPKTGTGQVSERAAEQRSFQCSE